MKRKQKDGTVITIQAPPMLAGYNKYMGGVDKSNQMKSYYGLNRKSKRWTLRLIWHFINIAAVNAYCLYKANLQANLHPPLLPIKRMDSLDFRCSLIDSLGDVFTCRKQTGCPRLPTSPTIAQGSHTLVRCEDIGQPRADVYHVALERSQEIPQGSENKGEDLEKEKRQYMPVVLVKFDCVPHHALTSITSLVPVSDSILFYVLLYTPDYMHRYIKTTMNYTITHI